MKELLRENIEEKYKWDLTKIYPSDQEFYEAIKKISLLVNDFKKYNGKISADYSLIKMIEDLLLISRLKDKVYIYAHLKFYEDTTLALAQQLQGMALDLHAEVVEALAF